MLTFLTNTYHIHPLPPSPSGLVELDMGCGRGSFTLALARRYPERLVLGSDVMIGRLRGIERRAQAAGLGNLQLLRASNLALVQFQLPPRSIDRIHLLCPDPWPKRHHQIRRLVCTDFLNRLQRVLKPGGVLHMSTDYAPYFDDWQAMLGQLPAFVADESGSADVADLKTDFERQWTAQGMVVQHLSRRFRPEA